MPEGLTQTKTPTLLRSRKLIGMPAGFISEWWPASNRNGGRLHVGIPGRNKSESALAPIDDPVALRELPLNRQVLHYHGVLTPERLQSQPDDVLRCAGPSLHRIGRGRTRSSRRTRYSVESRHWPACRAQASHTHLPLAGGAVADRPGMRDGLFDDSAASRFFGHADIREHDMVAVDEDRARRWRTFGCDEFFLHVGDTLTP